jgi:hypothetical protein
MDIPLIAQATAGAFCVILLVAWLLVRRSHPAKSTFRQLLVWYPLSAPWLLIRAPVLYVLIEWLGVPIWAAVVVEFLIERPLFYLTAREIADRVK